LGNHLYDKGYLMNKEELIAKIMTEVSDQELRNKLLASLAEDGTKVTSRE